MVRAIPKNLSQMYPFPEFMSSILKTLLRASAPPREKLQSFWVKRNLNIKNSTQLVILVFLTLLSYFFLMSTLVTTKGQVTIPKKLRDRYGIRPGALIDLVAGADGIQLRKVVKKGGKGVLGCLKNELSGNSISTLLDDLRGEVVLPKKRKS